MKKRRIKSKITMQQQLLAQLPKQKPADAADDDFWIFSIVRDDPERPTWEERMQVLGSYEICADRCVQIIDELLRGEGNKGIRLETYRGEGAEALLAHSLQQEAKYRQEIDAQPNN